MQIKIADISTQRIFLGWTGENKHVQFAYDFADIFAEYPDAGVGLTIQPPTGDAYPHTITRDGNTVLWDVLAADCAVVGDGVYQFTFTQGEHVVKSLKGFYTVKESLTGSGEAPTPVQNWIADAEAALYALTGMTARAETLAPDADATATIVEENGRKVIVLGIPQGIHGEKGDVGATPRFTIGTVTTLPPTESATVTITGTPEDPVLNLGIPQGIQGAKGDKGDAFTYDDFTPEQKAELVQGPILSAQQTAVQAVNTAGNTQVQAVNTAGANQVQVVNAAGTTQVAAVNNKGQEVLDSIPADFAELTEEVDSLKSAINDKADVIISSATGAIASFSDGADGMPVKALTVQIEPVQEGSGDPSPDNVCPITGWTGANVTRTGKNLLSPHLYKGIAYNPTVGAEVTLTDSAEQLTDNGDGTFSISPTSSWLYFALVYDRNQTKDYYLKIGISSTANLGVTYGTILNGKIYTKTNSTVTTQNLSIPVTQWDIDGNAQGYIVFTPRSSSSATITITEPQVELGSTPTAYEPYQGTSVTLQLGQTVYGGTLDPVAGVVRVESVFHEFDGTEGTSIIKQVGSTSGLVRLNLNAFGDNAVRNTQTASIVNENYLKSNMLVVSTASAWTSAPVGGFGVITGIPWIKPREEVFADAEAVLTWMAQQKAAETPLQVMLELATPIEITLDPVTITTLLGINNIWADCGDVSVAYRADTKLFCRKNTTVDDVQVNGMSVVTDGVANVPVAGNGSGLPGLILVSSSYGHTANNGILAHKPAATSTIKRGTDGTDPIVSKNAFEASFYGLAKAAGDSTQSASSNAVGSYTESAKSAISTMLNGSVSVSGTTPSITALPGIRYVCGEVATIDITVPASGIVDVVFESGSTATVLTITGTVKWANGFDPTSLDANTTYEINIADGLGVAASWT